MREENQQPPEYHFTKKMFYESPLGSRYEGIEYLGKGSQAYVYSIINKESNQKYALKVYNKEATEKEMLQEEECLQILSQAQSEYVVKMIESCKQNNILLIVLEFCESNLKTFWQQQKKKFGPIDEDEILGILKFLCNAYYDLMMNAIIHRDLKIENILVKNGKYKLSDFGISKTLENFYSQNIATKGIGSMNYMSPQQHLRLDYTSKCDVWSAGIIIYYLHQEAFPWGEIDQKQDKKQLFQYVQRQGLKFNYQIPISQDLKEILQKLLAYEENDRYSWFDLMKHQKIKIERCQKFEQQYKVKEQQIIQKIKTEYQKFCDPSKLLKKILNSKQQKDKKAEDIIVKPDGFKSYIKTLGIQIEDSEIAFLFNKIDHKQENRIQIVGFKKWLEDTQIIKTDIKQNQESIIDSIISYKIEDSQEDPTLASYDQQSDTNQLFDQIFLSVNPIMFSLIKRLDQKQLNIQTFMNNLKILFHQYENSQSQQIYQIQYIQQNQGLMNYTNLKKLLRNLQQNISDELIYLTFRCFDQNQTNQITLSQFEQVLRQYYQKYIYHVNYVILTLVVAIQRHQCNVDQLFNKYKQMAQEVEAGITQDGFQKLIKYIDQDITQEQIELAFDYFCSVNLSYINKQRFIQIIKEYQKRL